jgi:hypothetical protein
MFRTSDVHIQEEYIVHAASYGMLFMSRAVDQVWSTSFELINCLYKRMENTKYRVHVQYSLPADENMMFEKCKRQENLN